MHYNKKPVFGIGINDADYVITRIVGGKQIHCSFYQRWHSMIERCYSAKRHSKQPTYAGCKVVDGWHSFMAFKSWMELQDWKGKQLDKDLIGDSKLYSPENCVFVSHALNSLFCDSRAIRGDCPIGVDFDKQRGKYRASINASGKHKHLGYFTSADDAHSAWLKAKIEIANNFLANETNPRVRYAIECGIAKLK